MRTLILNSYAGSLVLGADAVPNARIIGSYEDAGFGIANQRANRARFKNLEPGFEFIDKIEDWPDQDLTEVVVLAHPPCSAYSQQNTSKAKRGVNTDAFQCTVKVLRYAMTNGAAAIAVESVPGALHGAWNVHESMAERGGYHIYRVMKNSLLFGVPQFRERFWCVFVRKGLAPESMTWQLTPKITTVKTLLDPVLPGTAIPSLYRGLDKFIKQLTTGPCRCENNTGVHGFDDARVRELVLAPLGGYLRRGFAARIQPEFFPNINKGEVCRKHVSPFSSCQPSVLADWGYTSVLLSTSFWIYNGKPVPEEGYKVIMGFPRDYIFPPDKNYGLRCYLSKGVCPPVATWILDNVRTHLGENPSTPLTRGEGYVKVCSPGRIVSFRPGRNEILERLAIMHEYGMPEDDALIPLRDEEDHLQIGADTASTDEVDRVCVPSTSDS